MVNSIAKFSRLVGKLCDLKWFYSKDSYCARKQYDVLIQSANSEWKDEFLQFKINDDRIYSFFYRVHPRLFKIQMLLGSIYVDFYPNMVKHLYKEVSLSIKSS